MMTPQEEAIKLLNQMKQECDRRAEKAYDSYCLYPNPDDQRDYNEYGSRANAVNMAIEALASRIPKKVKMELNEFGTKYRLSCPVCDEFFGHMWVHDIGPGIMPLYCDCGQRLDWSDVDDDSTT
jgi:hypothetical protein